LKLKSEKLPQEWPLTGPVSVPQTPKAPSGFFPVDDGFNEPEEPVERKEASYEIL
jgi:hypothetical protein